LGLHTKPIGLLDESGFFTPLLAIIRHAMDEGFIMPLHAGIVMRETEPAALLDRFAAYTPVTTPKEWVEPPPER
jgi:predicted Rossmann-fold nucleotide-binding protein